MSQCFSAYYSDFEIILPKDRVKFKNGLGVVNVYFNLEYNGVQYEQPLIGIVDYNYNFVMDLVPLFVVPKIDILSNNVIMKYNTLCDKDNFNYEVYSCKVNSYNRLQVDINLGVNDFDVIDDNLILLKSIMDDCFSIVALYDVCTMELLTPFYSYIGNFKFNSQYNEEVANANYCVRDENYDILFIISFLINKNGKVVSSYVNSNTNDIYSNDLSIDEVVNIILETNYNYSR